jgi:multidrug efflux pump subunit AcrA (membrane-fusion protein)
MAYSSGYGEQVSQANTGFANALANLASQRDAELSSTDLDQSEEDSAFNYDLQDLNNQQALYDAQNNQNLVAALAAQKAQSAQTALTQAKTAQAQAAAKKPKPLFGGLRRRL